jgi:glycosyltransferase involved in cell wall biosynthesis
VRPALVFATRRPPYPLDNGARIRGHHLLAGLAERFDATLVTFAHDPAGPDGGLDEPALRASLPGVEVVHVPGLAADKRSAQLRSLPQRRSWTFGRYRDAAYGAALRAAIAPGRPTVVHFDDLGTAAHGPLPGVLNVYSSHNVEARILRLGARTGSAERRLFNAVEALKVGREERRAWRAMDLTLACSELDAQAMRAGGARRVELAPNGAAPAPRLPVPPRAPGEPLRVLFVGSGNYAPYERGIAWFVREVLPRVRATLPATFDVVGAPPADPVRADGVRYLGRVADVRPHYDAAHAVVVPVFEGSGTRLKLVEAAALGRPAVSTTLGAEGLPLRAGEHFLRADDPDAFAAALVALAADWEAPERLQELLAGARAAIEPLLWPAITARLADVYEAALRA